MIKNAKFLGRFNKFSSQRCNTQMLRSSHRKTSFHNSFTTISCVTVTTHKFVSICELKARVRYFLTNFYLSPNDSPSKTMKGVFYFIQRALFVLEIFKFLYFHLPLFFSLSAIALELDPR